MDNGLIWLNKLKSMLDTFEKQNIELINVNREIESAIQFKNFKEGDNVVITKKR